MDSGTPTTLHSLYAVSRPPTVGLYTALLVVPLAVGIADVGLNAVVVVTALLVLALLVAFWRGSRVAWCLLLALEIAALISAPFPSPNLWALLANVAGLAILLMPQTREYVWHPAPRRRQRASHRNA